MTPKNNILIVDDDADFTEALSVFLEAHGYRVLKARDGRQALDTARRERPDLILMDIMMSERTEGFFAVQEIRRAPELAGVPVFILSALYSQAPEFTIAPDPAWTRHDEFFAKPVDLPRLLEAIERHLGAAKEA